MTATDDPRSTKQPSDGRRQPFCKQKVRQLDLPVHMFKVHQIHSTTPPPNLITLLSRNPVKSFFALLLCHHFLFRSSGRVCSVCVLVDPNVVLSPLLPRRSKNKFWFSRKTHFYRLNAEMGRKALQANASLRLLIKIYLPRHSRERAGTLSLACLLNPICQIGIQFSSQLFAIFPIMFFIIRFFYLSTPVITCPNSCQCTWFVGTERLEIRPNTIFSPSASFSLDNFIPVFSLP